MLQERTAFITGGASGMGRATAVEMARQGAKGIAIADIDADGAAETVRLIEEAGAEGEFVECDLTASDQIGDAVTTAVERFGGLDILHNCAGIVETQLTEQTTVETLPEEIWDLVNSVNVRAAWLATKAAAPHLRQSGKGVVINMGASVGQTALPMTPVYSVTKAAVVALTRATALDLADGGVRAVCISPGAIKSKILDRYFEAADDEEQLMKMLTSTHLIPRLGEPEDVAKLICFLASDDASFVTGALFTIDGGSLAWRGNRVD